MKPFALVIILILLSGCAAQPGKLVWRVKDMVLAQSANLNLYGSHEQLVLTIPTRTLQQMMLAHLRISLAANVQSDLFIVEGDEPNAFAGLSNGRRMVGVNIGMIKLIGDGVDEYAALLGHEVAHWAKGHAETGQTRTNTLKTVGALLGVGLGMAGVPGGGLIGSLGFDLIEASYSRDQEREADALSIEYMMASKYDPQGAIRLHEQMLKTPGGLRLPFLSSHPSGDERVKNLQTIIDAKNTGR